MNYNGPTNRSYRRLRTQHFVCSDIGIISRMVWLGRSYIAHFCFGFRDGYSDGINTKISAETVTFSCSSRYPWDVVGIVDDDQY